MHKIIIDTDPGIDDAQAIAFAVAHPHIELLALTTVFGNAEVDQTTNNALAVLAELNQHEIPVAKGAAKPLSIDRFPAPDFVHGADGMGNLNLVGDPRALSALNAAEFIVQTANQNLGEVSLIAIGPLTNVALALKLDPDLPSKLKQLIVMGGTVSALGNVSPVAEANFINDPHAADIVCQQDWPLSVVGLDVTMQVALTDDDFKALEKKAGSVGKFLWQSSRFYVDFYSASPQPLSEKRACAMHDASALVYLVSPDLFEVDKGVARVSTLGAAMGQLIVTNTPDNYLLEHWQNLPEVSMAMRVQSRKVVANFMQTLIDYYSTH